jgi:hypothetical protein
VTSDFNGIKVLNFTGIDELWFDRSSADIIIDNFQYAFPFTVTTQSVSYITASFATENGNITDLGIPKPTQYSFYIYIFER